MHNPEGLGEWDAQSALGFWDTNGPPNHTRRSDSQQKNER